MDAHRGRGGPRHMPPIFFLKKHGHKNAIKLENWKEKTGSLTTRTTPTNEAAKNLMEFQPLYI